MGTTTFVTIKNLLYVPAFLIGLSPEGYAILATLMCIDTLTGMVRSYVVHGGTSIKSYKLGIGVLSKLCIIGVPLLVVWAGRGSGIDLLVIARGALSMLVLSETYSILGNLQSIKQRKDVMEFDAVNFILKRMRSALEALIKDQHETK